MPNPRENVALAAVHSILLLALVGLIANFAEPSAKDRPHELSFASSPPTNCPGTKLNYPRTYTETIRGKKFSFRYNCIQSGFRATSYDGNCKGCSGRTRLTDEPVRWGLCAVDTDVIKPKSYFYVPGYGLCRAADTGGAVKGKKIDLGFDDVREGWWSRRYTDIYTFVK